MKELTEDQLKVVADIFSQAAPFVDKELIDSLMSVVRGEALVAPMHIEVPGIGTTYEYTDTTGRLETTTEETLVVTLPPIPQELSSKRYLLVKYPTAHGPKPQAMHVTIDLTGRQYGRTTVIRCGRCGLTTLDEVLMNDHVCAAFTSDRTG